MGALPSAVANLVRGGVVSVAGVLTLSEDAITLGKKIALGPTTAVPTHTPSIPSQQEVAQVKRELEQARKELVQWKHEWPHVIGNLASRKLELDKRETALQGTLQRLQLREEEAREYPVPEFLRRAGYEGKVNVAVCGNSGVGKSLFINTVRGVKRGDPTWAPVGVTEETMEPSMYELPEEPRTRLWDLSGAGSDECPRDVYVRKIGLRYFDVVLLLCATRFTETEILLIKELQRHGVPHFVVRTKLDIDIENNEADYGLKAEETKEGILQQMMGNAVAQPYLINGRVIEDHDFPRLVEDVLQVIAKNRKGLTVLED
mmetsp:Transcript_70697/g.163433  ORF Transcript_70697/g.163433 Transcript_70697/m.163433 type:complete len:317 (+) Transcript_70697:38-988(+)